MKAFIRCRHFLLMRSRLRPPEKLDHLQVLPTTPFPATFHGPSQPRHCLGNRDESPNIILFPRHSGTLCGARWGPCDYFHR